MYGFLLVHTFMRRAKVFIDYFLQHGWEIHEWKIDILCYALTTSENENRRVRYWSSMSFTLWKIHIYVVLYTL